jgi:hypothetical protein
MVLYPLDVLKTYISVANKDLSQAFKNHGPKLFYRGFTVSICAMAPFIALRMSIFDQLSTKVFDGSSFGNCLAGSIAGLIAVSIMYPFDPIRRNIQVGNASSVKQSTLSLYQNFGYRGFFKGYWATCVRTVPMAGIMFVVNEKLKKMF